MKVQEYIREGCEWVVDIDLEKFFDKVNHDILMSRVARKVKDKKIMPITRGWANYFSIAEARSIFASLDGWIRRKIRGILWRQWEKPRTRCKQLMALGVKENTAKKHAYSSKGPWRMAKSYGMHKAMSKSEVESMGYIPMMTLVCGRS